MVQATLKNYRQSPRKVRLVADAVRGKKVEDALITLQFMPKRAAMPVKKLIESAFANAKSNGVSLEDLFVKTICVDKGPTMKRWMPKARGSADPIRKRTSILKVVLDSKKGSTKKSVKTEVKKVAKKPVKKIKK